MASQKMKGFPEILVLMMQYSPGINAGVSLRLCVSAVTRTPVHKVENTGGKAGMDKM